MKRIFGTFVILAAMVLAAVPQSRAEAERDVQKSFEDREYKELIRVLLDEKARDPGAFRVTGHGYLLARAAEADGQLALAMQNYQDVARDDSELSPFAIARLARIVRSTGNLSLESIYLHQLENLYPDHSLAAAALDRLAENSFDIGRFAETIRILTLARSGTTGGGPNKTRSIKYERERHFLLGMAHLQANETEKARRIFTELVDKMPEAVQPDDQAQTAVKVLDLIEANAQNAGTKGPELTESEHLRRANIYQFNRDFADARKHYEAIIARFPAAAAAAIFQIGRTYSQAGEHLEAMKWYERVLERYPDDPIAKDSLLQAAASYSRVGKPREAITRYENFIEKYPSDEKLDRAYLNIVDIIRDQGLDQEALKWCLRTEEAFRGKPVEAVAIFTEARIYIAREEWPQALTALERLKPYSDLGGSRIPGGSSLNEVAFLKAFVLEQSKRYAEAIDAYLAIPDGRGDYYGWRASERLIELKKNEEAQGFIAQKVGALSLGLTAKDAESRREYAQSLLRLTDADDLRGRAVTALRSAIKALPRYSSAEPSKFEEKSRRDPSGLARRLTDLGLYDDAILDLGPDAGSFTRAALFIKGDRADKALAIVDPAWQKIPADYPLDLVTRSQLRLVYPAVYREPLLRYSTENGVDPRLILAIMRQESRFQADALSNAAARGLMQFISTTSTRVAGELGYKGFSQDDLYHPATSILFGTQYVAGLYKLFPDHSEAVVASYNGGSDNMKRWLARSRSGLPDRYVPEIMFTQTKDYVCRVMANYRMYRLLYDEDLEPAGD